jgi:hypothetical protein
MPDHYDGLYALVAPTLREGLNSGLREEQKCAEGDDSTSKGLPERFHGIPFIQA